MHSRITVACLVLVCLLAPDVPAAPLYSWAHGYGDEDVQTLSAVAVDGLNNVVLCGTFSGTITIKTTLTAGLGGSDIVIAKLDPVGNPLWNRRFGYGTLDLGWDVATDKDGNVIAVGDGTNKILIVKYDPGGNQQWLKVIGSAQGGGGGDARYVATTLDNGVVVAGRFYGTVDFGGGPLVEPGFGDGYAMYLVKFDASGNHVWSRAFEWIWNGTALAGLETDALGQVALYGDFTGSIDFGSGALTSTGYNDLFVAKFFADGRLRWNHRYGNTGIDPSTSLAVSADGRVAIGSNLYGPVDFGGGSLTPTGSPEPCVAVFTPDGDHAWSRRFAGTTYGFGSAMTFAEDDLLISCTGQGTLDFGGGAVAATGVAYNVFLARLSGTNGAHRWSFAFGGDGNVNARVAENRGRVVIGGTMEDGAANPGGGLLPFGGTSDFYVARFDETLTGAGRVSAVASLEQNIPNPFNPITTIRYTLASASHVVIDIFNPAGARVRRIDAGTQPAGPGSVVWNGRDDSGRGVASGVYVYRVDGMPAVPARKMVLLK